MSTPRLSYFLHAVQRTGSYLLAGGLEDTGLAGHPTEWFNESSEKQYCRRWGIPYPLGDYEPYLQKIVESGTTANGIFGVKCLAWQFKVMTPKFEAMQRYRSMRIGQIIPQVFPNLRHIALKRRDKIRQAISFHRANQTQVWWDMKGFDAPKKSPPPTYDPISIAWHEWDLERQETIWQNYFTEYGIEPLTIYYEDMVESYEKTVGDVLRYLGVSATDIHLPPPKYKKQSDVITEDWVQRYLEHKRGKTGNPALTQDVPKIIKMPPPPTIPPTWKRWIAENKLINIPDQDILAILKQNGIDEQMAAEELRTIDANPYFQAANSYTQLLHKRDSFAMIQRTLSRCDPKTGVIERRSGVSRTEFLERYYAANRPVILSGLMESWKARRCWTPEYLEAACGAAAMAAGGNEFFKKPQAQFLWHDIEIFSEYLDKARSGMFLWYGPKGTVTPLHHEQVNILIAQVYGRQQITLVPAAEMDLVYNLDGVYSAVDVENPDYGRFPKFREATVIKLELMPGEVLFLPVGWWHHMRALDSSITVAFTNFLFPNHFEWVHPAAPK